MSVLCFCKSSQVALGEVKCEDSRLDCSSDCLGEESSRATEQTPTILTGDDVSEMMVVEDEHVLPCEFVADSTSMGQRETGHRVLDQKQEERVRKLAAERERERVMTSS